MKGMFVAAALLGTALALAQTNQPAPQPNGQAPHNGPGSQGGQQWEQRFEEVKARRLEHIATRIAEVQQVQACMQVANNLQAMNACSPVARRPMASPERFEEAKPKRLEHIKKLIAELQELQDCVQAASNPEALRACRLQQHLL
jgi:hypothetical protein